MPISVVKLKAWTGICNEGVNPIYWKTFKLQKVMHLVRGL